MLIPILELILYWNGRLEAHPPMTSLDWEQVCKSTLIYLNAYQQASTMLVRLAKGTADLPEERQD